MLDVTSENLQKLVDMQLLRNALDNMAGGDELVITHRGNRISMYSHNGFSAAVLIDNLYHLSRMPDNRTKHVKCNYCGGDDTSGHSMACHYRKTSPPIEPKP